MTKKQPIIFTDAPQDDFVEGEQTMDLLLHYAKSGLSEAENLMRNEPDLFTEQEIIDFVANKVVLAKAPDILDEYKKKVREFELMQEKIHSVVSKCDNIFSNYELRKQELGSFTEPGSIQYGADGEMVIAPAIKNPTPKINITLPKPDRG